VCSLGVKRLPEDTLKHGGAGDQTTYLVDNYFTIWAANTPSHNAYIQLNLRTRGWKYKCLCVCFLVRNLLPWPRISWRSSQKYWPNLAHQLKVLTSVLGCRVHVYFLTWSPLRWDSKHSICVHKWTVNLCGSYTFKWLKCKFLFNDEVNPEELPVILVMWKDNKFSLKIVPSNIYLSNIVKFAFNNVKKNILHPAPINVNKPDASTCNHIVQGRKNINDGENVISRVS